MTIKVIKIKSPPLSRWIRCGLSGNKLGVSGPPFQKNTPSRSVNENCLKLKSILNQCVDKCILTKITSAREKNTLVIQITPRIYLGKLSLGL